MGLLEGSYYAKIALLCLAFALLLHLIAFSAPNWAETNLDVVNRKEHYGLWRYCSVPINGGERCDDFIDRTTSDWIKCCQAFLTLALFALIGSVVVCAMYAVVPGFDGEPRALMAGLGVCGVTTLFLLVGVATFGAKYNEFFQSRDDAFGPQAGQLSWAFGVGATSLCLTFAATGLLVIEMLYGEEN